jgi:hypothetical protein
MVYLNCAANVKFFQILPVLCGAIKPGTKFSVLHRQYVPSRGNNLIINQFNSYDSVEPFKKSTFIVEGSIWPDG